MRTKRTYRHIACLWYMLCIAIIACAQTPSETLTNVSIISMKKMKLGNAIIKSKIVSSPCTFATDVAALGELKDAGIDDEIIEAMIAKSAPSTIPVVHAATAPSPHEGILTADEQTYIAQDGTSTFVVGKTFQVNVGTNTQHPGYFTYIKAYNGKIGQWLTNESSLEPAYAGQSYTIIKLSMEKANMYDIWVKHPKKVAYLYFETNNKIRYKVAIDAALYSKEISVIPDY